MKKPASKLEPEAKSDEMVIGIIRGTHGLSGTMKIQSTSGEIEHFFALKEVRVKNGNFNKLFTIELVSGGSPLLLKLRGIESQEDARALNGFEILVPRDLACPLNEDEFYIEDLKNAKLLYYPSIDTDADSIEKTSNDEAKQSKKNTKKDASTELFEKKPSIVGYITDVVEGGSGQLLEVALTESVNALLQKTDTIDSENDFSKRDLKSNSLASEKSEKKDAKPTKVFIPFRKEFIGNVDIAKKEVQLMHLWILD